MDRLGNITLPGWLPILCNILFCGGGCGASTYGAAAYGAAAYGAVVVEAALPNRLFGR